MPGTCYAPSYRRPNTARPEVRRDMRLWRWTRASSSPRVKHPRCAPPEAQQATRFASPPSGSAVARKRQTPCPTAPIVAVKRRILNAAICRMDQFRPMPENPWVRPKIPGLRPHSTGRLTLLSAVSLNSRIASRPRRRASSSGAGPGRDWTTRINCFWSHARIRTARR
jgi:hypothetical protein